MGLGQLHHPPKAVTRRGSATACVETVFGGATTKMGAAEGVGGGGVSHHHQDG